MIPLSHLKPKMSRSAAAVWCAILAGAMAISCQSIQKDLFVNSPKEQMEQNLAALERAVAPLEKPDFDRAAQQAELKAARQLVNGMERGPASDPDFAGKLAAWSGRLAIQEGRYREAQRLYREAQRLSPGSLPLVMLSIRLEGDPEKRLGLVEREIALASPRNTAFSSGTGELHIEQGRALFELRRYREAAAAFDAAFAAGLDRVYREAWGKTRSRAWELRNADGYGGPVEILERGDISWKNFISLAKNETGLLRFLSASRNLSEAELFNRLAEQIFIPASQDAALLDWTGKKPLIDEPVLRSGAAWFLWRLYAAERADPGLLTKYSARFAQGGNPRSPIPDIPALSPFLDPVMGCVERELLSLPDGRSFSPAEPVRAAEMLDALKKIDK